MSLLQSTSALSANSLAFTSDVTAGSLLVIVAASNVSGVAWSISDSAGNEFRFISPVVNFSAPYQAQVFYVPTAVAGPCTITVSGGPIAVMAIHEFDGGFNAVDAQASATGTGNAQDSGGATIGSSSELLFGYEAGSGQTSVTHGTGWTTAESDANNFLTEYQVASSTGTFNATTSTTTTKGGAVLYCVGIITFKRIARLIGISTSAAVGESTETGTATVAPVGVESASAVGSVTATVSIVISISGIASTAETGAVSPSADGNATPAGVSSTTAVGAVVAIPSVTVVITGLSAVGAVGTTVATGTAAPVQIVGIESQSGVGQMFANGSGRYSVVVFFG